MAWPVGRLLGLKASERVMYPPPDGFPRHGRPGGKLRLALGQSL
jgi:hypothetical protein